MHMKRRMAVLLAICLLLPLIVLPSAAAKTVYFTAVNENVLELTDASMPFWSGDRLYVDSAAFSSGAVGVGYARNRLQKSMVLWDISRPTKALFYDLAEGTAKNGSGESVYPGAIVRNDHVFVAAAMVAEYFGFTYANLKVDHGYLVWLHSSGYSMPNAMFVDSATYQLDARYNRYQKKYEAAEEKPGAEPEPETEEPSAGGQSLYLCMRLPQDAGTVLGALAESRSGAAFYLTEREIRDNGDLVRQILAAGHAVGLLADAQAGDVPEQLRAANAALFEASGGKSRLCRVENGGENELSAAREAGYCCLQPKVDFSTRGLYSGTAQSLLQAAAARRGSVTVWLSDRASASGIRSLASLATMARDRLLSITETV